MPDHFPDRRAFLTCAKTPCVTCPYSRDVPSGVWAASEYAKLLAYDGSMADQAVNGGGPVFDCHQDNGKLCAGWVGCHGAINLLALRLTRITVDPDLWKYKSPVKLFASGAAAAEHGMRAIKRPGQRARYYVTALLRKRARRKQHKMGDFLIASPEGRRSFYINSADGSQRYNDFFIQEFIPRIESKYRTQSGRTGRAISGI